MYHPNQGPWKTLDGIKRQKLNEVKRPRNILYGVRQVMNWPVISAIREWVSANLSTFTVPRPQGTML